MVTQRGTNRRVNVYSIYSTRPLIVRTTLTFSHGDAHGILVRTASGRIGRFNNCAKVAPTSFHRFIFAVTSGIKFTHRHVVLNNSRLKPGY